MNQLASPTIAPSPPTASVADSVAGHALTLERITHAYGALKVIKEVTLEIKGGEMVALLGPSGCGKTTLLRAIAGFIKPTQGRVLVDGAPIEHLPPNQRNIGIVFQNYALFPHMTVAENIAYGLQARSKSKGDIRQKVEEMIDLVQMRPLIDRLPKQLSGGQQQRVALARAMAIEPKILLLDEPFGALDKNLRLDMQIEVKRIQQQLGITTVMVTHDQEEALSMADRIAVINQGWVEQFDTPGNIYDRPATVFVNQFVGTTNLIPGKLLEAGTDRTLVQLDCGPAIACEVETMASVGDNVWLSVRPERLRLHTTTQNSLPATVVAVMPLGPSIVYEVKTAEGTSIKVTEPRAPKDAPLKPGDPVAVTLSSLRDCAVFPAMQM